MVRRRIAGERNYRRMYQFSDTLPPLVRVVVWYVRGKLAPELASILRRSAQLEYCWRTDVIGVGIYSVVVGSFEVRFSLVVVVAPWGMWRRWRRSSQAAARLRPVSL